MQAHLSYGLISRYTARASIWIYSGLISRYPAKLAGYLAGLSIRTHKERSYLAKLAVFPAG